MIVLVFVAYESSSSGLTLVQQRSPVVKVFAFCNIKLQVDDFLCVMNGDGFISGEVERTN